MEGVAEASTTRALLLPRPHHRHVAGVIDDAFILLVGRLVLLIDDDEAQVGEGQETAPSARPATTLASPFRRAAPDPGAAARRQAGMPFRRRGGRTARRIGRETAT